MTAPKNPRNEELKKRYEERAAMLEKARKWAEEYKEKQQKIQDHYDKLRDRICPNAPKTIEEAYPEPEDVPELNFVDMPSLDTLKQKRTKGYDWQKKNLGNACA